MKGYRERASDFMADLSKIPCVDCGTTITVHYLGHNNRCDDCREKFKKRQEEIKKLNKLLNENRTKKRLDKAIDILKCRYGAISEYNYAINWVRSHIKPKWFQTVGEIVVALELMRCKVRFNHQERFGTKIVDFSLPELKVILEVDGVSHTKEKDNERDKQLRKHIPEDWEIIHVEDNEIKKDPKLLIKGIKRLYISRRYTKRAYGMKP